MVRGDLSRAAGRADGAGRATKRKKAPDGVRVIEREGRWYVRGSVRAGGHTIPVRKTTGLPARADTREAAEALRRRYEAEAVAQLVDGKKPSQAAAVAVEEYLKAPRRRPLGKTSVDVVNAIAARFAGRALDAIHEDEWFDWVDRRQAGNKAETRERFLNSVVAFLNWCAVKKRRWVKDLPDFERDNEARNPRTRGRRKVPLLDPTILALLLEVAPPHLAGQLVVEMATGGRVSSVLYACTLSDLVIGHDGTAHLTYRWTKNGDPVTAYLPAWTIPYLQEYLAWRGRIWDRAGPLFLTDRRKAYKPNDQKWGGQNKTAFRNTKGAAIVKLRGAAAQYARELWRAGRRADAWAIVAGAREEGDLIACITQHWFRHNMATRLLHGKTDIRTVMEQGGWRDPASVMAYLQAIPAHQRSTVETLLPAPVVRPAFAQPAAAETKPA